MRIADFMTAAAGLACSLLLGTASATAGQATAGTGAVETGAARVTWLLFVDDLHLDLVRTGSLRDLLRAAAATLGEDGSLVGLRCSGPALACHVPSTSRTELEAVLKRIIGNGSLRASDFFVATSPPGSIRELRYRAHTTLSALHTAVASLASVPTSHKQVLFVSNGFTIVRPVGAPLSPWASRRALGE